MIEGRWKYPRSSELEWPFNQITWMLTLPCPYQGSKHHPTHPEADYLRSIVGHGDDEWHSDGSLSGAYREWGHAWECHRGLHDAAWLQAAPWCRRGMVCSCCRQVSHRRDLFERLAVSNGPLPAKGEPIRPPPSQGGAGRGIRCILQDSPAFYAFDVSFDAASMTASMIFL